MARLPVISRTPKPAAAPRRVPVVTIDVAVDAAAGYARASRSPATWRAYEADWRAFRTWCLAVDLNPLPATSHTVALRGGFGISDRGIRGFLAGRRNRRDEIHGEADM